MNNSNNETDKLLRPAGWRILVRQPKPPTQTKSGLILAKSSQEIHEANMTKGQVVALGPLCFQGERFNSTVLSSLDTAWVKPGDYVLYAKHIGTSFTVLDENNEEVKYRFINDTDVLATFPDENAMKRVKGYVYEGEE